MFRSATMPNMNGKNPEHSPLVTAIEPNRGHKTIVEVLQELVSKDTLNKNTILLSDLDGCLRYQPKLKNSVTFNFGKIHPAEMELMRVLNCHLDMFGVVTNQAMHGWFNGGFWGDGRGQQISRIVSKARQILPVTEMTAFADFFVQEQIKVFGGYTKYFLPLFFFRYKLSQKAVQEVGDWIAHSEGFAKKEMLIMIGDWVSDITFGQNLLFYLEEMYGFKGQGLFFLIDGKVEPNYDQMSELAAEISSLSK